MRITPKNELEYRFRRLQNFMAGENLDAVIVVQNADLFYFTGTIQSGNLYVPGKVSLYTWCGRTTAGPEWRAD